MIKPVEFEYWPVNWVDGMSINKDHFIGQDLYLTERLNDLGQLNLSPLRYGIVPPGNNLEGLDMNADIDNQKVIKINLKRCTAITSGGVRINIPGKEWTLPEINIKLNDFPGFADDSAIGDYYVILTVNPFKTDNWGVIDPNEEPPRKPFAHPSYNFSIFSEKDMASQGPGPFTIPLHVFSLKSGQVQFDQNYVPPCMTVGANKVLNNFLFLVLKNLRSLETDSIKIVQKVRSKHQENLLARAISYMAEQIFIYSAKVISELNLNAQWQSPLYLIERIVTLARIIKNSIDTWQGNGKEETLSYLSEWCELNQGAFEKSLNDLIDLQYNHYDIRQVMKSSETLLKTLAPAFKILSDLDYIGKKIDTNMFVKEDIIDNRSSSGGYEEETIKPKKGLFGR